jgi:hypothetical protein
MRLSRTSRARTTDQTDTGALWSVIEAEGHTKVATVAGKTVLTALLR